MISYLKEKYYWYNTNQKLKSFLISKSEQKILMYGYPKSGNTWLRFLLFNYRNLLLDPSLEETITYDRLNTLQNNVMDRGTTFIPEYGFPFFYRTHKIYKRSYDLFDFKIFIHRNPMDTLISAYHFYKNREIPFSDDRQSIRNRLFDIDFYIRYKLDNWIEFYYESIKHADFVISYSELQKDCFSIFSKLIKDLGWDTDVELIKKSVEISSFEKIREMGRFTNQKYGNGPNDGSFQGEFTRSGLEGQFNQYLKHETKIFVINKFPSFGDLYPGLQ